MHCDAARLAWLERDAENLGDEEEAERLRRRRAKVDEQCGCEFCADCRPEEEDRRRA